MLNIKPNFDDKDSGNSYKDNCLLKLATMMLGVIHLQNHTALTLSAFDQSPLTCDETHEDEPFSVFKIMIESMVCLHFDQPLITRMHKISTMHPDDPSH